MTEAPRQPLRLRVTAREQLTDEIVALELRDPSGAALPAFEAGAHIDVHTQAQGEAPRLRSYSLCNAPSERHRYRIAVQREATGRGGSRWVHEQLQHGVEVTVGWPRNLFALRPAPHTVLLAGGIGLTPLLAMAESLWASDRSFELHVAVRSRDRLAFAHELALSPWNACIAVHVDDETSQAPALDLASLLARQPADALVYTCGPAGFMAAVQGAARALGWDADRVVLEHFAAPATAAAAAADQGDAVPAGGFALTWAPTGERVTVQASQSTAQALMAAGIAVSLSCEQGICGECCVQVLAGQPDHRDLVYGDHDHQVGRRFTPCCSRSVAGAATELVLAPLDWVAPA